VVAGPPTFRAFSARHGDNKPEIYGEGFLSVGHLVYGNYFNNNTEEGEKKVARDREREQESAIVREIKRVSERVSKYVSI